MIVIAVLLLIALGLIELIGRPPREALHHKSGAVEYRKAVERPISCRVNVRNLWAVLDLNQ